MWAAGGLLLLTVLLLLLARCASRTSSTLSRCSSPLLPLLPRITTSLLRRQKRSLLDKQEYVQNVVKAKKAALYSEYLQQTVSDQDL